MANKIPLYLITGFLGSGKTSVINSLLSLLKDKKVGLVLNDFGHITVDSHLVKGLSEVVASTSLSGGQIFCSCLSGSFVKSVVEMTRYNPDYIIVEASGLAKPSPLLEIVSHITDQTNNRVTYGGMMCVVDAERYHLLSKSLMTLEEQVVFSDWFIVNKSDLVTQDRLDETLSRIKELKPLAPIYTTTFGSLTHEMMKQFNEHKSLTPITLTDSTPYDGWGTHGRPKNCLFIPSLPYEISDIEKLLTEVAPHMLRMKGFVPLKQEDKALLVDVVGLHITCGVVEKPLNVEMGIMCLYSRQLDAPSVMQQTWDTISTSSSSCVEYP